MKIFLDTEFYEFAPKNWRTRWVTDGHDGSRGPSTSVEPVPGANAIQLISLGAVREDGAEFYAENADFDWDNVPEDHWIQENVRPHLWAGSREHMFDGNPFRGSNGAVTVGNWSPARIAEKFRLFAAPDRSTVDDAEHGYIHFENPEFWGWYCDYDWVVLCGLYGRMVDLPYEFPRYCRDLKQEVDRISNPHLPPQPKDQHHALADARWVRDAFLYTRVQELREFAE